MYSSSIWRRRGEGSGDSTNHVETVLVTPPAVEPVSVTQLRNQARVPWNDEDDLLSLYITAARETVEKFLRRALISQQWDFKLDWGPAWLELPKPPIISVDGVFYTDLGNVEHAVPTSTYITDTATGLVGLNIGNVWPLHRGKSGFRIRYTAGYGIDPSSVPATIRRMILALAANMDSDRTNVGLSATMQAELRPYRHEGQPYRLARGTAREDLMA